MKISCIGLVILLFQFPSIAQQNTLFGEVYLFNSRYNTDTLRAISKVHIEAPFSTPTATDYEGGFLLTFAGVEKGVIIGITAEKIGLEVVNSKDLNQVVIGRKEPLRVFMAKKGYLAKAQTKMFVNSKKALYTQRDSLITRLRAGMSESQQTIRVLEKRFDRTILDRYEAEMLLNERIEQLEEQLPEFALQMASQNLDFASDMFIEAHTYFMQGKIDQAIASFNGAELERQTDDAFKHIMESDELKEQAATLRNRGLEELRTIIQSYDLKAQLHLLKFEYTTAAKLYERIIGIQKQIDSNLSTEISWYRKAAWVYYLSGQYNQSLQIERQIARYEETRVVPDSSGLSEVYDHIAVLYNFLGRYDSSIFYHKKAISIRSIGAGLGNPLLGTSYNNISLPLRELGLYSEALKFNKQSLKIGLARHPIDSLGLAMTYGNRGNILLFTGQLKDALYFMELSLSILKAHLEPNHPQVARSFGNVGFAHHRLGNYDTALVFFFKGLDIETKIFGGMNPYVASSCQNIGVCYKVLGDFDNAKEYLDRSIYITSEIFGQESIKLADPYSSLGNVYKNSGKCAEAEDLHRKALDIQLAHLGLEHPALITTYNNLALTLKCLKRYDEAFDVIQKATSLSEAHKDSLHLLAASSYDNAGLILQEMMEYRKAVAYQKKCISIREKKLDSLHSNLATAYHNISVSYAMLNVIDSALNFQKRAMQIKKQALPAAHPHLADAHTNLGVMHKTNGNYLASIFHIKKAIEIDKVRPERDWILGITRKFLVQIYVGFYQQKFAAEDFVTAMSYLDTICSYPHDSLLISTYYGKCEYYLQNYEMASQYLLHAAKADTSDGEKEYFELLGMAFCNTSQADKAFLAFKVFENHFPDEAITYRNWAVYYALTGQKVKAIENLQKAIEIGDERMNQWLLDPVFKNIEEAPLYQKMLKDMDGKSDG